jgi:site-specific recombinase XerD
VFTGRAGQPINPRDDHTQWKRLLASAGVPEARLHDARHTAATILTALGIDSAVIQTLLGHSSVATTRGYQDLTAEILSPAIEALHTALSEQRP